VDGECKRATCPAFQILFLKENILPCLSMVAFGMDARVAIADHIRRANIGMRRCAGTRQEIEESMLSYVVMDGQY